MKLLMSKLKPDVIVTSSILVFLGVITLIWPERTRVGTSYLIAFVILAVGVCMVLDYRKKRKTGDARRYSFALSLAVVLLGVYTMMDAKDVSELLPLAFAFLVLFSGLDKLQFAWELKKLNDKNWPLLMLVSAIGVVIGFLLMLEVLDKRLENWLAMSLIYSGFTDLIMAMVLTNARMAEKEGSAEK